MQRSLLSGRSQQRLIDLHRAAHAALQELAQQHTVMLGALRAGDAPTQRAFLDEYRARANAAVEAMVKLAAFLDHCRISDATEQSMTG